jgi:hypothetical protein
LKSDRQLVEKKAKADGQGRPSNLGYCPNLAKGDLTRGRSYVGRRPSEQALRRACCGLKILNVMIERIDTGTRKIAEKEIHIRQVIERLISKRLWNFDTVEKAKREKEPLAL